MDAKKNSGEKKKIKAIYYALQHSRLLTGPIFLKNDGFISSSQQPETTYKNPCYRDRALVDLINDVGGSNDTPQFS